MVSLLVYSLDIEFRVRRGLQRGAQGINYTGSWNSRLQEFPGVGEKVQRFDASDWMSHPKVPLNAGGHKSHNISHRVNAHHGLELIRSLVWGPCAYVYAHAYTHEDM